MVEYRSGNAADEKNCLSSLIRITFDYSFIAVVILITTYILWSSHHLLVEFPIRSLCTTILSDLKGLAKGPVRTFKTFSYVANDVFTHFPPRRLVTEDKERS